MKQVCKELISFFENEEGWDKEEILSEYIAEIFKKYKMCYFDGPGGIPIAPDELVISYGDKPMDLRLPVDLFAEELFDKIIEGVCNVIKTA